MFLDGNTFTNGESSTKGGAITWTYYSPDGLLDSTFYNNTAAIYGDDISAVPQKLIVVSEEYYYANIDTDGRVDVANVDPNPTRTLSDHTSGSELEVIYIGIFDEYDNLVKTDNDSVMTTSIEVDSSETFPAFITETITLLSTRGLFKVEGLLVTSTPGTTQTVSFTTSEIDTEIPSNVEYLNSIGATDVTISYTVEIRECVAGEELRANGACEVCEAGIDYLLEAPTTVTSCIPCPLDFANCLGGDMIVPKPGFWRSLASSDEFLGKF